jgi:predicted MFS family arabinose efflux permease
MQRNMYVEFLSMIAGFLAGIIISYVFGWSLLFGMLVTVSMGVFADWIYTRMKQEREARNRRN